MPRNLAILARSIASACAPSLPLTAVGVLLGAVPLVPVARAQPEYVVGVGGNPNSCRACGPGGFTSNTPVDFNPPTCTSGGAVFSGSASAHSGLLHVSGAIAWVPHAGPCGDQGASAVFRMYDLTFSGPPGATTVPVSFALNLNADLTNRATWSGGGAIVGTAVRTCPGTGCGADQCCGDTAAGQTLTSSTGTVSLNSPQLFYMTLSVTAAVADGEGNPSIDATLSLGSGPVFNLPPGYTANAPSIGLVNNHFSPPPCPVDIDGNGAVQPVDVALFINTWLTSLQQGTLAGDFDHNGVVEPADVGVFINAWFAALSTGSC